MSIVVITGPPGAGKTTIAAAIARDAASAVHLRSDECFSWIAAGYVLPWLPGAHRQNATVIEAVAAAAATFARGGYDVVVDGIFGPWFLEDFRAGLDPGSDEIDYVVLRPSRDVTLGRATARVGKDDLVDPKAVGSMYDAFDRLGPFERFVVDSTEHSPAATIAMLREGLDAGRFRLPASESPSERGVGG